MEIGDGHAAYSHHFAKSVPSDKRAIPELCDVLLDRIKVGLPYFEGMYDPHAYIEWELNVDHEFRMLNLSKKQKVRVSSSVFTNYALTE